MNQLYKSQKISKLDIDTLFSNFIFVDLNSATNMQLMQNIGSLEMFNRNINISNLKTNENDMQVIANILYNDMAIFLLIVGFTLFISLILLITNVFYSLILKKRSTLYSLDIYKVINNHFLLYNLLIPISSEMYVWLMHFH